MRATVLALIVLAAAGGRLSAEVSVSVPDFGTVRAGETATIEWKGLPKEVEELELLLSVEGRELPVRVTPQLAARAGTLVWRVPNLPSRRARLTVRFGLEGREVESASSAAFEILPSQNEPAAVLVFREGEWCAQERSESPLTGLLDAAADGDRIQEEQESPPCA